MKKLPLAAAAAAAALLSAPMTSSAHHSTAMFEWGKPVQLSNARVVRWEWTNPHTFIYVTVPGSDGKEVRWAFEGMSPSHLARNGWSKRTLKPGDVIDLSYYPLRDGRRGGFNIGVTLPSGAKLAQLPVPQS